MGTESNNGIACPKCQCKVHFVKFYEDQHGKAFIRTCSQCKYEWYQFLEKDHERR